MASRSMRSWAWARISTSKDSVKSRVEILLRIIYGILYVAIFTGLMLLTFTLPLPPRLRLGHRSSRHHVRPHGGVICKRRHYRRGLHQVAGLHAVVDVHVGMVRSEEHTSELQSRLHLVCRLLLEKK